MKRIIRFEKGHNCRDFECTRDNEECHPDSLSYHGVSGMDVIFFLKGKDGAVQFKIDLGWIPYHNSERYQMPKDEIPGLFPFPSDLGYHSYKPRFDGQEPITDACDVLDGKPCYYDGSGMNACKAFYTLVNAGEESLWDFLEQYYAHIFYGADFPKVCGYEKLRRK